MGDLLFNISCLLSVRNISAVIASDTRKHENSEIEFRKQIILLQNEIHGLNSITNTTRITDVDYVCGDLGGNPASDAPAEEGKCESCEGEIEELRSLVESLRRKLKGSMANEMATAGELIKLRAVLISTNSKHDAECAKLAVWTAAVETSGAAEAEAVGVARGEPVTGTMMSPALYGELSSNDTVANAVFLQSKIDLLMEELRVAHKSYEVLLAEAESKDAELDALRVERTQVAAGLCEILSQNEKLTSACAELRRTMSEREKESNRRHATNSSTAHAESESDVIKDLRIQLSIKRISENGLLLREMQDLQEEVRSLQQENSLLTDLQESVKIGGAKYAELSMSKSTLEDSLVLSNSTVATLTGEAEILKVLVVDLFRNIPSNKCPETVSLRRRITDLKIKIEPEKTVEDQERKFQNDLESSDSGPENSIIESDIEKQILGSEEEVMRMKERREGLKKSKLLIHDSSDKVEGMGVSRRREIAALRALNRDLEERLLTAERLLVAAEAKAAERAESSEEEEEDEDERCCMFKDRTEHLSRDGSKGTERSADSLHDKDALYIDGNRDRDRVLSTALSHPTSHAHPRSTDSATSCSDQGRDSQLVQRIFALENAAEMEKRKFEGRIRILLKLSGMYDSTYSNFIAGSDHSDDRWKEVVRAQSDLERKKVMTLKTILMRFTSKLTADEVDELEDCGVILAPRSRPRNRGLNLGSALCFV